MAATNRKSIYSFGDEGVTASVSTFGRLLRVSKHFAGQNFGYCVDHPSMPEPYYVVDRVTSLHSMANDSGENLGIDPKVDILDTRHEPSAELVHDRWPHFTTKRTDCEIEIQFFASNGIIYQTYEFTFEGTDNRPPKLTMGTELYIRELDFIDFAKVTRDDGPNGASYRTSTSADKTRIKRSHDMKEGQVALFIFACCNDELLTFRKDEENKTKRNEERQGSERDVQIDQGESQEDREGGHDTGETYVILWSDSILDHLRTNNSLRVTFAYRVEFSPRQEECVYPQLDINEIETAGRRVSEEPFEEHNFTENPDINRLLRRNLEHILSVCSIPVVAEGDQGKEPAIALTCGDADDHRVATAASFYCFELLLLAMCYFERQTPIAHLCEAAAAPQCYVCIMKQRILRVCKGHLKWLFGKQYRNLSERPSSPHCWVSGKEIEGWQNNPWLPPNTLVEVPFQLIKAGDFASQQKDWKIPREVGVAVRAWIRELDQRNKLGRYAFPRYSKEPTHSFYLTDHVFIWRAARSAEILGQSSKLKISIQSESGEDKSGQPSKKGTEVRNYSSVHIRNEILGRFTTENPISKKKMLAVSRSPTHNRFLLRTKDAGLFYAMDLGLFDKPRTEKSHDVWQNKIDIWRNLVDAQVYHEDNDDATWDEPLRFALSFIMAQNGKRMNLRSAEELRQHAVSVLVQGAWPNGLLPGQLDANKEPTLYDSDIRRDAYWAMSFEIPYLLWRYSPPASTSDDGPGTDERDESKIDDTGRAPSIDVEVWKLLKEMLERQLGAKGSITPTAFSMGNSFPLNNGVDKRNIVELSDEWLYNEPDFFAHTSTSSESIIHPPRDEDSPAGWSTICPLERQNIAVVDLPWTDTTTKTSPSVHNLIRVLNTPSDLKAFMQRKRSPGEAKKRFCALFSSHPRVNKAWHQTPSEQPAMEAFSQRHISYSKFFSEETAAELNKWTTELHLSCYAVDQKRSSSSPLIAFPRWIQGRSPRGLARVSLSFRFDGDFFDRYWTCHFLEYDPRVPSNFDVTLEVCDLLLPRGLSWSNDKREPWRQRRVLELILFDRVVCRMKECTDDILKEVRLGGRERPAGSNSMAQGSNTFVDDDDYTFDVASGRRQEYQQMLQTVEQDLRQNLATIELWLNRENERGQRPRWSFNDESRYRDAISKLLILNRNHIRELRRNHVRVSNLNELIRSELDQRQAADIKRFTTITMVFLPLGFATGIFSMSEAPDSRTLISMVITAVIALATTALFLRRAEPLERLYNRGSRVVHSLVASMQGRKSAWDEEVGALEAVQS